MVPKKVMQAILVWLSRLGLLSLPHRSMGSWFRMLKSVLVGAHVLVSVRAVSRSFELLEHALLSLACSCLWFLLEKQKEQDEFSRV